VGKLVGVRHCRVTVTTICVGVGVPDHVGVVWGSVAGYGVGIDA